MKCAIVKKSTGQMQASPRKMAAAGDPAPASYLLTDNEDGTLTVSGVDAAGQPVDISAVATLSASSNDTSILTVDPANGMVVTVHGVKPGSANAIIVATWNDGSIGPFTIQVPVSVSGGPATGITVLFGTPTVRTP